MSNPLPHDRYIAALRRIKGFIAGGRDLHFLDNTTLGSKSTVCTWGLCDDSAETWPDADDHKWPDDFRDHGRVAPRDQEAGQWCPLDRNLGDPEKRGLFESVCGCFYRCRVFQPGQPPSRKEAAALYSQAIEIAERSGTT